MVQSRSRVILQSAYVLHTRPYRDTSLLIDVFSRDYGIVPMVARGARRRHSRMRGMLQPFRLLQVSWSGRGEVMTLIGVEDNGSPYWFRGSILASAFYLNELLLRLMQRHDAHPELFQRYQLTVSRLAEIAQMIPPEAVSNAAQRGGEAQLLQKTLRCYEKYLLQGLGYGMILDHDVQNDRPIQPHLYYRYYHEHGPVLPAQGEGAQREVQGTANYGARYIEVRGQTLLALARDALDDAEVLKEAKYLMRGLLAAHLGDKPLGSRMLLDIFASRDEGDTVGAACDSALDGDKASAMVNEGNE